MAITIDLPPTVEQDAAAIARARGETLADLAAKLIAAYVDEKREQREDVRAVDAALARIELGEETWLDWEDVKADLDALPD